MTRGPGDILQLLANPTNRAILTILALEPQYPRRLAELVGLTEDEASRRLRSFEKLGLAEAEWANLGRTVRLYKLASARFTVGVTPNGITVTGLPGEAPVEVGAAAESAPTPKRFVGREAELVEVLALLEARKAVCVHGIGGVGKTTLAATVAERVGRPAVWHTLAPMESGNLLLARLAANLRALETGERAQRLYALRGGEEGALLLDAIAESANALRALVVLDRFEGAGEGAGDVTAELARRLDAARLLVTSRSFPKTLPRELVAASRLSGLAREEARALFGALGASAEGDLFSDIYDRTQGHPLSLVLVALVGDERRDASVERLMMESGIRDFLMTDVLPQLTEAERDVLLALSVLREPFTADDAEAVAATRHARDVLLRLEARGLVTRAGDTFAIHDLVRTFAEDAVPNRREVHGRAARLLAESGEPAKVLEALHHHLESGNAKAAAALVREEATRRAYRFMEHGLAERYRELLVRVADAPGLDAPGRGAAELELGLLAVAYGDAAAATERLVAAARLVGGRDDELAAPLALSEARRARLAGDVAEARRLYEAAEAAAERVKDPNLLLEVVFDFGNFTDETASEGAALPLFERAIALSRHATDLRLASLAYVNAARMLARRGDERVTAFLKEAERLARLGGSPRGEAAVEVMYMTFNAWRGDPQEGLRHANRYLELGNVLGDPWYQTCADVAIACILTRADDHEGALAKAEVAMERARAIRSTFYLVGAATALGDSLNALGRYEETIARLRPVLDEDPKVFPNFVARAWSAVAAAERALGRPDAAADAEARALAADPGHAAEDSVGLMKALFSHTAPGDTYR